MTQAQNVVRTIIVLLSVIISSCNGKVKTLEDAANNDKNADSALQNYEFQYVPLETTEQCVLNSRANICWCDSISVFITSGDRLYRFATDGHFLNRIGKRGKGADEYTRLVNVSFDNTMGKAYFYDGNKRIAVYGYEGKYRRDIMLCQENQITAIERCGDGFITEERDNKEYKFEVRHYSADGKNRVY